MNRESNMGGTVVKTVTGHFAHFPVRPESFRPGSFRPRVVSPSVTWVVSPSYPESFRPLLDYSFCPLSKLVSIKCKNNVYTWKHRPPMAARYLKFNQTIKFFFLMANNGERYFLPHSSIPSGNKSYNSLGGKSCLFLHFITCLLAHTYSI